MQYRWDDRRIVCSASFDDLNRDLAWDLIEDEFAFAADQTAVTFIHAPLPTFTLLIESITLVLDLAESNGLDFVTFPELVPVNPRAGVAIAFDDTAVREWILIRDLLAARGVRVTFFITRVHGWTDEELGM